MSAGRIEQIEHHVEDDRRPLAADLQDFHDHVVEDVGPAGQRLFVLQGGTRDSNVLEGVINTLAGLLFNTELHHFKNRVATDHAPHRSVRVEHRSAVAVFAEDEQGLAGPEVLRHDEGALGHAEPEVDVRRCSLRELHRGVHHQVQRRVGAFRARQQLQWLAPVAQFDGIHRHTANEPYRPTGGVETSVLVVAEDEVLPEHEHGLAVADGVPEFDVHSFMHPTGAVQLKDVGGKVTLLTKERLDHMGNRLLLRKQANSPKFKE